MRKICVGICITYGKFLRKICVKIELKHDEITETHLENGIRITGKYATDLQLSYSKMLTKF
jgi:hypothetical protein